MAANASRTMFKVSKILEDSFKEIGLYSCHYLAKSNRYRQQYLNEFKKMSGKGETDQQKKDKAKQKEELEKIRIQIKKLKEKLRSENRESDEEVQREERSDRGKQRQKAYYSKKSRHHEKQYSRRFNLEDNKNQKYNHRSFSFQNNKKNSHNQEIIDRQGSHKKVVNQQQIERQLDFEKDESFHSIKKGDIYEQIQSEEEKKPSAAKSTHNLERVSQKKPTILQKKAEKILWSKRSVERIGSENPQKYKILRIDEQTSDFEDQNAPLKVPEIKPRKPLTPYFLFLRKNRYRIQKEYPNVVQIGSLTNIWKRLSDDIKKQYIQQYARANRIYERLMVQYNAINPAMNDDEEEKMKKDSKDKNKRHEISKTQQAKRKKQFSDSDESSLNKPRKKNQGLVDLDQYDF